MRAANRSQRPGVSTATPVAKMTGARIHTRASVKYRPRATRAVHAASSAKTPIPIMSAPNAAETAPNRKAFHLT